MIGTWEILLIILMVLILFGANKIPDFVRNFNSGIKEFKKAANDLETTKTDQNEWLITNKY